MRQLPTGFFAALLAMMLVLPAGADEARLRTLFGLSGLDGLLASVDRGVRSERPPEVASNPEIAASWDAAVEGQFVEARMLDDIVALMGEDPLSESEIEDLTAFYASDLGRWMTEMEVAAQTVGDPQAKTQEAMQIVSGLLESDPGRIETYQAISASVQAPEIGAALAMTMAYATTRGMFAAAGDSAAVPADDEIWAMLTAQKSQIMAAVESAAVIESAYAYRDATDADLAAYLEFLKTPLAQTFYRKTVFALSAVLAQNAERFGRAFAEDLNKRRS